MMSENISRGDSAESSASGMKPGTEESKRAGSCSCQSCRLYRCYPPMMLITTALAAVFCWMYITKPVFLTTPEDHLMDARPAVQEKRPVEEDKPTSHTAGVGNLDPALGRLPGDPAMVDDLSPEDEIPGEKLKPLIVNRRGPSLFRPIPSHEMSGGKEIAREPLEAAVAEEGSSGPGENQVSEEYDVSPVGARQEGQDSGSEEFRVNASIMAEFSAVEQKGGSRSNFKP